MVFTRVWRGIRGNGEIDSSLSFASTRMCSRRRIHVDNVEPFVGCYCRKLETDIEGKEI